ncbi:O-antigen ligase family protein [[Clostridium] symbiosum]|uniref:O-antigen ligase family protein n=1 Tax=Clostridium symbiosum TaxID=1512 RepID=UPI0018984FAB|nr:O-antigen ligase family protein [[Clostridium] symbiosum]MDY3685616.1 O-antigen ligase family protein [[Clostridium] symbiosum]
MTICLLYLFFLSLLPGLCKISVNGFNINLFGIMVICLLPILFVRLFVEKGLFLQLKNKKIIIFLLLWLFVDIISIFRAIELIQWIKYNYFFISGLSLAILVSFFFRKEKTYYHFFAITNAVLLIHNILGWSEILFGNYLFLPISEMREIYINAKYPVSMFGNTNDFAIFLSMSIFMVMIFNEMIKNILLKIVNCFLLCSSCILILKTQSRACWLALLVGFLIVVILKLRYSKRTYRLIFFVGIIFCTIAILGVILVVLKTNVTYFDSIGMRINLIKNGFKLLFDSWGMGVGSSNIEILMLNDNMLPTGGMSNMHNWWVELLVSFGVLIFMIYIIIWCKFLIMAYKAIVMTTNIRERNIYILLFALLFVFAVSCISSSSINSYGWIWILYGNYVSFYYFLKERIHKENIHQWN